MALSMGNRQRAPTSTLWAAQQQQSSSMLSHTQQRLLKQHQQQQLLVRKQHSFIDTTSSTTTYATSTVNARVERSYSQSGTCLGQSSSVGRVIAPAAASRQKNHTNLRLQKHASIDQDFHIRTNAKSRELPAKSIRNSYSNLVPQLNVNSQTGIAARTTIGSATVSKKPSIVAWSSTSSLLKSLDTELAQVAVGLDRKNNANNSSVEVITGKDKKAKQTARNAPATTYAGQPSTKVSSSSKPNDANKINLNIVLTQTIRATTEHEPGHHSDIESSSEPVDDFHSPFPTRLESTSKYVSAATQRALTSAATASFRRAQFQASRSAATTNPTATYTTSSVLVTAATATTTSTATPTASPTTAELLQAPSCNFSASPSLTVKRRPPLLRAMSAPVRSLAENSKSVISTNKRKPRRRKLSARNISFDKADVVGFCETDEQSLTVTEASSINESVGKKVLSRSKSVVASSDVITLVSLISSEGSDSEKEDIPTTTTSNSNSANSPTRRAPCLRKTGKSVSFQESYPASFQLAAKEYSHMLRRGSIAPFAARLRGNRPPTAPLVSIFARSPNDSHQNNTMSSTRDDKSTDASEKSFRFEQDNLTVSDSSTSVEYVYPEYVHSIKERECWKLYQKMLTKGVNVTYDTILRGMLTPTEFRQLQKQRETEEAKKARELEEQTAQQEICVKRPTSAVERLSESLLKK